MNGKEQCNIANTHVSQISTFCPICFIFFSKLKHSKLNRYRLLCFSKIPLPLSIPLSRGGHCPKLVSIFLAHVFTFLLYICSLCNIHIVLLIFMLYQKSYCHTVLIIFLFSSVLYFGNPTTGHTSLVHSCSLHRMRILIALNRHCLLIHFPVHRHGVVLIFMYFI